MSDEAKPLYLPAPLRRMKALKASWKPILLNWLVPGLGYWVIGEKRRAKILASVWVVFCILGALQMTFGAVNGVKGGIYVPQLSPIQWMPTLAALATSGVGPVYAFFGWAFGGAGTEPVRNLTQEYGASYVMIAGLLNWLACMDIFDRTTDRYWWRLPADEQHELSEANRAKKEAQA